MTSTTWGVKPAITDMTDTKSAAPVNPHAARAGHQGIVWIHLSAIAIWVFTAVLLGILMLAGKHVPGVIVIGGFAAALGHALFLAVHLYLGKATQNRAAQRREAA